MSIGDGDKHEYNPYKYNPDDDGEDEFQDEDGEQFQESLRAMKTQVEARVRDQFASDALRGSIAYDGLSENPFDDRVLAQRVYLMADAMMEARKQETQGESNEN